MGTEGEDLGGFPETTLDAGLGLARIHGVSRAPWWFGSSGDGRFDLAAPDGTCYLAMEAVGAFIEVFDGLTIVPEAEIDVRRLSWLSAPRALRVADLTSARCRGFGVTAAVHSSPSRPVTQRLAAAFRTEGFDGFRYLLRNDPAQQQIGIALFDDAGVRDHPVLTTTEIPRELLDRAASAYGIETLP